MTQKQVLKQRFKKLYPGRRLLAVQLDGFSHAVVFDGGNRDSKVTRESFSGCMPEGRWSAGAAGMFAGIGHNEYQNNPKEIIFLLPEER
jgi:hypothetical protein